MSEYPPLQIVDENDKPIGEASLQEIHKNGLPHRSVIIVLRDKTGRILLQRRSNNVATNANRWDMSAAGHVDQGEDYKAAAQRELYEELGVQDVELTEVAYYHSVSKVEERKLNRFIKLYETTVMADTQFKIDPDEVSEVKWFSLAELKQLESHREEFNHDFDEVLGKILAQA